MQNYIWFELLKSKNESSTMMAQLKKLQQHAEEFQNKPPAIIIVIELM